MGAAERFHGIAIAGGKQVRIPLGRGESKSRLWSGGRGQLQVALPQRGASASQPQAVAQEAAVIGTVLGQVGERASPELLQCAPFPGGSRALEVAAFSLVCPL